MRITIIGLILAGLVFGTGVFMFSNKEGKKLPSPDLEPKIELNKNLRLEIVRGKIFELEKDTDTEIKELENGAVIAEGVRMASAPKSRANLHFPDGSILRLDEDTKILISEGTFNPENKSLRAKISLEVGRVWSKIVSLATPQSLWEVKTPQAVATVRGTAFGTEYRKGRTKFIGSENKVVVAIIDPITNAPIEKSEVIISQKQLLDIEETDVKVAVESGKAPEVEVAGSAILNETWVKESVIEDTVLESENQAENQPETKGEETSATPEDKSATVIEALPKKEDLIKKPRPSKLTLTSPKTLERIAEGSSLQLKAEIIFNDSTRKDVTTESEWKVIGPIGSIKAGLFLPGLDATVTELGEAPGSIYATWKDQGGGEIFSANTPIFKVYAEILPSPDIPI